MAGGRLRAAEDGRLSHQSLTSPCRCQQHSPVIAPLSFFPALAPSSRFQQSDPASDPNSRLLSRLHATRQTLQYLSFCYPPPPPPTHASFKFLHSPISPASLLTPDSPPHPQFILVSLCLSFRFLPLRLTESRRSFALSLSRTHTRAQKVLAYISHGVCNTFSFTSGSNVLEQGTCCAELI